MVETEEAVGSDLRSVAASVSAQARTFLTTTAEVASGAAPEAAIPLLLLATSDLLAAGARLGAMMDVVPDQRFEPDAGPETDLDPLREGLARLLDGLDDYPEIEDPVLGAVVGQASVSGDIACIAEALAKGLQHYDSGQELEALWWWQFSYLSLWGERAASALRVLQLVLAHLRLDVEDDVAAEAEYDALHA
ncbi:DUF5063 domain-containing protein [Oerskovia turbata]|uniref:DUF5063 domain-containing protein n=1 Tax=Oerskovia turbata TaxID=1713 RepID=A0A4Q1L0U9_9CELL|nr:DUF5063 domain-containing protein [Oerskovia turbata]RXR27066.1 DUF5063 domain-containing protein [Oerskovia turbata]RXR36366.1 DUF5063 domain-containing protein [Oerskovia turbata]TGJ94680.1 DUF5063 domain-containing protein [Actinotalea fermentans ATCC 43279 = JCM 9966 = DSM 3133]